MMWELDAVRMNKFNALGVDQYISTVTALIEHLIALSEAIGVRTYGYTFLNVHFDPLLRSCA